MKSRILNVTPPLITGFPYFANGIAIISCYKQTLPWFLNNFIQMHVVDNKVVWYEPQFYTKCPWLEDQKISRNFLNKTWNFDIVAFIQEMIEMGSYILMTVDQQFIPASHAFGIRRFEHLLLVYGFDPDQKKFYIADNLKDHRYMFATCSFDEMEKAYMNVQTEKSYIELVRFLEPKYDYEFSIEVVQSLLDDYRSSTNTSHKNRAVIHNRKPTIFGLDCYHHIDYLLSQPNESLDIRPLHQQWDHKKVMTERLRYLIREERIENGTPLLEKCQQLEQQILIQRNLLIKFNISHKSAILDQIRFNLEKLRVEEKELIDRILESTA